MDEAPSDLLDQLLDVLIVDLTANLILVLQLSYLVKFLLGILSLGPDAVDALSDIFLFRGTGIFRGRLSVLEVLGSLSEFLFLVFLGTSLEPVFSLIAIFVFTFDLLAIRVLIRLLGATPHHLLLII